MKKALISFAAAAAIAAGTLAAPTPAEARCRGGCVAAIIGGVALGAILLSQYRYQPGYVRYRSYRRSHPVTCRGGYWARKPVYRHGRVIGWSDPRFICP